MEYENRLSLEHAGYKQMCEVIPGEIVRGDSGHYYMKMHSKVTNNLFADLTNYSVIHYTGLSVEMVPYYTNPFKSK